MLFSISSCCSWVPGSRVVHDSPSNADDTYPHSQVRAYGDWPGTQPPSSLPPRNDPATQLIRRAFRVTHVNQSLVRPKW